MCLLVDGCLWRETMLGSSYYSVWMVKRFVCFLQWSRSFWHRVEFFFIKYVHVLSFSHYRDSVISFLKSCLFWLLFFFFLCDRFSVTSCTKPKWPMQSSILVVIGYWRQPQLTTRWNFGTWETSKIRRASSMTFLMTKLSTQVTLSIPLSLWLLLHADVYEKTVWFLWMIL